MGGGQYVQPPQETTAQTITDATMYLPQFLQAMSAQVLPTETALQNAQSQLAPQAAQTNLNLLQQYGPQMNAVGNQIANQNALAQSGTFLQQLNQYAQPAGQAALNAQKSVDPAYFANIQNQSGALNNLFSNLPDTGTGLTGSQTAEIQRSLNRQNAANGLTNPTSLNTVSNAMTFGQAGLANQQAKQQMVENALGSAAQSANSLRSGINPTQLSIGMAGNNVGQQQYQGPQQYGATEQNAANALLGTSQAMQSQFNNNMFNKMTGWSMANQGIGDASQIIGAAGGACCWTFMEFYGDNIPWYVRAYRDKTKTTRMWRGYRRFSRAIIPLMRRFSVVRNFVKHILVNPATEHCAATFGLATVSHPLVAKFWFTTWNILGGF